MGIQKMSEYYIEITKDAKHGLPPVLVPLEEAHLHTGFRSVYAYPYESAEWIHDNNAVSGFKNTNLPVYSDCLFVDIDDDPESAELLTEELEQWGIGYQAYDSGGRSIHLHIDIVPMEGIYVPESQLAWLKALATAAGADFDTSIYHPVGLYRLTGTTHQRTGLKKELVHTHEGAKAEIEMLTSIQRTSKASDLYGARTSLARMIMKRAAEGGRRFHVWKIASHCIDLGYDFDYTMEHVRYWNDNWCQPALNEQELARKLHESFRGRV